ncbi:MAG: hypothetical protein ACI9G1_004134 [Pirellulaceae bacterium]|jgi:hypothetical protein
MADWIPPTAVDWTSLAPRMDLAYQKARRENPHVSGGVLWAPLVAVDRTDGRLFAFPQSGALWVSKNRGQTFEWLNHDVLNWGFNESPTNLYVHPEGAKIRIFSSERSGFSLDGGRSWKYMNFNIKYGFEDGQINWDGGGDSKLIVARSHTWPKPRMWLSRDAGENFVEYSPEITEQINTQNMALMDAGVLLFQAAKLLRSEDYGKTLTEVPPPEYAAPDGKKYSATFMGVSRRFKDKVYWLNTTGVYSSADQGKTWKMLGTHFPHDLIKQRLIRSGPLFGKDENHLLVLCLDRVIETLDGGKSWHVLAKTPVRINDHPWAHSFAYDPNSDVLYCNNRGHSGGPFLFGRLALKRWGEVEQIAPSAPADLRADLLPAGNGVKLYWKPSTDASGMYTYRVFVDGVLTCYAPEPELVLSNYDWNQELKIAVQAEDAWQNLSAKVEKTVRLGTRPANSVLLRNLKSSTATMDGGPMELLIDTYEAFDKSTQPISFLVDGYEPNPIPRFARKIVTNSFGIRVKPDFQQGVLEYALDQKYTRLLLDAGMSDSQWDRVQIKILLDGKEVLAPKPANYETLIKAVGRRPEALDVDVTHARTLRFEIAVVNNRYWQEDLVVFANAMLIAKD